MNLVGKVVVQLKEQSKETGKKRRKRPGGTFWASIILVCAALLTLSGIAIAKYTQQWSKSSAAVPANFCFVSDYLKEGGASYDIYTGTVAFVINSTDGVNRSDVDITYHLTTDHGELTVDSTPNPSTLTLTTSNPSHKVTLSGTPGSTCTVTATSSSPYAKTLSATFTFMGNDGDSVYQVTDGGNYCELIVKTGAKVASSITVNWPGMLAPDNTNPLMKAWVGTSGSFAVDPNSTYHLIFFKNDSNSHAKDETVLEGSTISLP